MTKNRAALELVFAGALWGFGFVAAIWALTAFTPYETMVYRLLIATVVGEFLYLIFRGPRLTGMWADLKLALPAGLILGSMLLTQTIGLQYTTATKSGFITALYVILVPLMNTWFFKNPSSWKSYLLAAVALFGTALLVNADLSDINPGDLWTLACAVLASFHIIYIGKVSNIIGNAFRFNNFQSFWACLISVPFLINQESITVMTDSWKAWTGILMLGIASSVIAFYLQIRTQKILSDTTASMLFLLESPFAALFGFLILSEHLRPIQIAGAVAIMFASVMQILWAPASKTTGTTPQ
ncbi:DMT family transporter [Bdellovibrio sp. HCB2-146]|uniref:DMT family transporter n=1 Tax=Bdellovibrio sp. HCB2-146 TaxID=3394362 RepID=UPI0039BC97EA